ncbi:54S ribosomal protein L37, mitochondrial [Phlyctema vagabunda]|uniref:Large ribosomal subunit protein mL54 n=1 Tax=Phlyctema vagabunda TaxID=108571 RepID=A0ABR4P2H6_9HELO
MICTRCTLRTTSTTLARGPPRAPVPAPGRFFSNTRLALNAAGQQTTSPRPGGHAAATSTSAAQPFSTPATPKLAPAPPKAKSKTVLPVSKTPAGVPLKGLNYLKGRDDPVALPEEEYPEWLWHCLDVKKSEGALDESMGDEFSKSKKQRRVAAKRKAKMEAALLASGDADYLTPKVPLQKQSIDLASNTEGSVEGGFEAVAKREELRKAMRSERRAGIKEKNYLKSV